MDASKSKKRVRNWEKTKVRLWGIVNILFINLYDNYIDVCFININYTIQLCFILFSAFKLLFN